MRVLITGGAGFIGSHIVDRLVEQGHEVSIIDNLYTGKKENINPNARFFKKDIRNKGIGKIFAKEKFEAVLHLAAQMDVRKSVEDPFFDADVNIIGGLNLLENSARYGVKRFIFASSGGVMYGECSDRLPTEEQQPMPLCPYGNSKLALEYYLNFYRENYGLDTVVLRLGNVYGPRQDPHGEAGVVAIFTGAMLKDAEVKIFGDGNQLRDYVYVGDVAEAFISVLEKGSRIYNIGTGVSESVNELYNILKNKIGYKKEPLYMQARSGELNVSRLDVARAMNELGLKAKVNFEQGLEKTIDYFRSKN